jgi:hypothetical protein
VAARAGRAAPAGRAGRAGVGSLAADEQLTASAVPALREILYGNNMRCTH